MPAVAFALANAMAGDWSLCPVYDTMTLASATETGTSDANVRAAAAES